MRIIISAVLLLMPVLLSGVQARQVDVVYGWDKPPYIIANGNTGFEIELVKSILAVSGHTANMLYVPMGRSVRMVNDRSVDVALTMNPHQPVPQAWLSDVYVVYQNVVITLKSRNKKVDALQDLKSMTVIGFHAATRALGADFASVVASHPGYLEVTDQRRQVSMLLLGSVDALVMDYRIFEHIRSTFPKVHQAEVDFHYLFDGTSHGAAIPDPALRRQFNEGLRQLKADGTYTALSKKFLPDEIDTSYANVH